MKILPRRFSMPIVIGLVYAVGAGWGFSADREQEQSKAQVKVEGGIVVPKRQISESLVKAMNFLKKSDGRYIPGDISGELAGYFSNCMVNADGSRRKPGVCYPARHHAYFIRAFLRYYGYSGEGEWLLRARDLADWNIDNSTSADAEYDHMPYSTLNRGRRGKGHDQNGIEPDKAAFIGSAYLDLYYATGDAKYLAAARRIADGLVKNQRPDGSWPFRVVPEDGTVIDDFGGAPVLIVEFLEQMLDEEDKTVRGDNQAYHKAFAAIRDYMLETNVGKLWWGGYHEDIRPSIEKTYSAAEQTCFTAMYLFRKGKDHPQYVQDAMKILEHINGRFVHRKDHIMSPAPAVAEQPLCNYIMPGHTARYCSMLSDLYLLTKDDTYRRSALSGINGTTYMQTDNGLFRTWIWSVKRKKPTQGPDWYSQHLYSVFHILETMQRLPELAPQGEDHYLGGNVPVRSIKYEPRKVTYSTSVDSTSVLRLSFEPKNVTSSSRSLKQVSTPDLPLNSWRFDRDTGALYIRHTAGRFVVSG